MSDVKESVSYGIPQRTMGGIDRYVEEGIHPGHFLKAVITNNLLEALERADNENISALYDIMKYFFNSTPSECWGSIENFNNWRLHRGKAGYSK